MFSSPSSSLASCILLALGSILGAFPSEYIFSYSFNLSFFVVFCVYFLLQEHERSNKISYVQNPSSLFFYWILLSQSLACSAFFFFQYVGFMIFISLFFLGDIFAFLVVCIASVCKGGGTSLLRDIFCFL